MVTILRKGVSGMQQNCRDLSAPRAMLVEPIQGQLYLGATAFLG